VATVEASWPSRILHVRQGLLVVEPAACAGVGQLLELLQAQRESLSFGSSAALCPVAPFSSSSMLRELASAVRSCTLSCATCAS
jgi:hypothetical protein